MTPPKSPPVPPDQAAYYEDTNGVPVDGEGRVTHLGVKPGDLANRLLSVGSISRARLLASMLQDCTTISSPRGFTVFTGSWHETPISVVATGMGHAMMDFLVREARHVLQGPVAVARLGTCGSRGLRPGTVVVNSASIYVYQHLDAWLGDAGEPYRISREVPAHAELSALVEANLRQTDCDVDRGLNASCDTFYATQERYDPNFDDRNLGLFDDPRLSHLKSIEMESYFLFHLARCASSRAPIAAAAAAIVCADRLSGEVIQAAKLKAVEAEAGRAVLSALAAHSL